MTREPYRHVIDLELVDAIVEMNATLARVGMRLAADHWSCWTSHVPPRPARPEWSAVWQGTHGRRVECTLISTGHDGQMWRTVLVGGGMVTDAHGATWIHDPGSALRGLGSTAGLFAVGAARLLA